MGWEISSSATGSEVSSDQNSTISNEQWSPFDELSRRNERTSQQLQQSAEAPARSLERVEFEPQRMPRPSFGQMLEQVLREPQQRRYYAPAESEQYRYSQDAPNMNGSGHLLSDQMGRSPRGNDRGFVQEQQWQEREPQQEREQRINRRGRWEQRMQQDPRMQRDPRMDQDPRDPRAFERRGLFGGKPLFGARGAEKNEAVNLNKVEFNSRDEQGVVKELWLPDGFRADAENDQSLRIYTKDGTDSKLTIYGARDLSDEDSSSLQTVLSQKKGLISENSPQYDAAVSLMGGGFHSFYNKPEISTATVNGKDVILLTDNDPQQGLQAYTMFVPSDRQEFLYAVSFDGKQTDFNALKPGLDRIQWRRTPDAIDPPKPFIKR